MGAENNKTLKTRCSSCDAELVTHVAPDVAKRTTWPLLGETSDGKRAVFPACTKCYNDGWRPPGYVQHAIA